MRGLGRQTLGDWERAINLEIVYSVVDPSTSEVRPKMFKVLARITDGDDREFQQSYGRCSAWARRHDKSPVTNYVAPEPDELAHELAVVKAWFERVRKYRNEDGPRAVRHGLEPPREP